MDRERIERRDFSVARRGYDPGEVDEHLRRVADEIERSSSSGLASSAAEQIRGIVDAAEQSAADIQRRAEEEARRASESAEAGVREARERADAEAAEHVERVRDAADRLLERTAAAEAELDRLLEALQTQSASLVEQLQAGVGSVTGELNQIRDAMFELRETPMATEPAGASEDAQFDVTGEADEELPADEPPVDPPVDEPEPTVVGDAGTAGAPPGEDVTDRETDGIPVAGLTEDEPGASEETGPPDERVGRGSGGAQRAIAGTEGARLIALNMALNGTPREETARYLAENFSIDDQDTVLDEVYSRVGG